MLLLDRWRRLALWHSLAFLHRGCLALWRNSLVLGLLLDRLMLRLGHLMLLLLRHRVLLHSRCLVLRLHCRFLALRLHGSHRPLLLRSGLIAGLHDRGRMDIAIGRQRATHHQTCGTAMVHAGELSLV